MSENYVPRKKILYKESVIGEMVNEFNYSNVMMVPRLQKIVLNISIKEAIQNIKLLEAASAELSLISGQKAVITRARKSIANFKLRDGMPIGTRVTLRGDRMWEFFDRLVSVTMPRIRDFRGVNAKSFDGRGNYTFGLTEQLVFPEIEYDKVGKVTGMNISFVTSANTDGEGRELLRHLGMPFANA